MFTTPMNYAEATETRIELQKNQRGCQIIDTLIKAVICPLALAYRAVLTDRTQSRV